jgi:DNA modification methylase
MDVRSRIVGHGDEPPDQLLANPLNFRRHPGHQMDALRGSMRELGWVKSVLVNKRTGYVLDGHARVEEALRQKLKTIPVTYVDLSPEEERIALAVLDPITEIAIRDQDALSALLSEVTTQDKDIQAFLATLGQEPEATILPGADLDEAGEPPSDPITKPGDLIELGRHRLLCGDSTNIQHAETLMAGAKAEVLFTDPPYNAAFNGRSGDFEVIKNDDLSTEEFSAFLGGVASMIATVAAPEQYVCCRWEMLPELLPLLPGTKTCIVWAKNVFGMGRGYRRQHELILYAGSFDSTTESDLWECARDAGQNYVHPTQKPVALIERALKNSSTQGQTVLDLFGGSGSTLIACESTGRSCRMLELDPRYCDVIVNRWEKVTGQKAKRPETHKELE